MVRTRSIGFLVVSAVVAALSFTACSDSEQQSPIAPTPVAGVAETGQVVVGIDEAAAVGEGASVSAAEEGEPELKVAKPTIQSPSGDVELSGLTVTLEVANAGPTHPVLAGLDLQLSYRFELDKVDANGVATSVVLAEPLVEAGQAATQLVVPGELDEGTSYRWRARAERFNTEGKNFFGHWSDYGTFRTPVLATISAPTSLAPQNGATGVTAPIILEVTNGETTGSVGVVIMTFEIATDSGFSNVVDTREQIAGQHNFDGTGKDSSSDPIRALKTSQQPNIFLEDTTLYYWRVKAHSQERPEVSSGYSQVFSFTTADPNAGGSSGGGSSSGGGGGGSDDLDLGAVTWLHTNISGWRVTSTVTNVTVSGSSICIRHTKAGAWPIVTVGGTPLEGNPWVIANIGGKWYAGTYEWLRPGQVCKGITAGNIGPHIKRSPMTSWRPRSGETVYFGVSTGARFGGGHGDQRSNFVKVTWP
jgi:hypothetical protein